MDFKSLENSFLADTNKRKNALTQGESIYGVPTSSLQSSQSEGGGNVLGVASTIVQAPKFLNGIGDFFKKTFGGEKVATEAITKGVENGADKALSATSGLGQTLSNIAPFAQAAIGVFNAFNARKQGKQAIAEQRRYNDLLYKQYETENKRYNDEIKRRDEAHANIAAAASLFERE